MASKIAADQRPKQPNGAVKNTYLLLYNAVSAALWVGVLYNVLTIGLHEVGNARKAGVLFGDGPSFLGAVQRGLGSGKVYKEMESYTRVVQSLAGMEILHSLFGTSLPSTSFSPSFAFPK
jgi:very-long-chain (3R)-3-hydroxyacyl-CoA dehydratase